jgi:hypothetical protein
MDGNTGAILAAAGQLTTDEPLAGLLKLNTNGSVPAADS